MERKILIYSPPIVHQQKCNLQWFHSRNQISFTSTIILFTKSQWAGNSENPFGSHKSRPSEMEAAPLKAVCWIGSMDRPLSAFNGIGRILSAFNAGGLLGRVSQWIRLKRITENLWWVIFVSFPTSVVFSHQDENRFIKSFCAKCHFDMSQDSFRSGGKRPGWIIFSSGVRQRSKQKLIFVSLHPRF